jgi:hypothetical protein
MSSGLSRTSSVRCTCRSCGDCCSTSTERTEPVKPGDTIVAAMGAPGSVTAVPAPADDGVGMDSKALTTKQIPGARVARVTAVIWVRMSMQ